MPSASLTTSSPVNQLGPRLTWPNQHSVAGALHPCDGFLSRASLFQHLWNIDALPLSAGLLAMALTDESCFTCRSILCPDPDLQLRPKPDLFGWIEPTGQTLSTLRDAALNNCPICSTIWKDIEKQRLVPPSNSAAEASIPSIKYRVPDSKLDQDIPQVDVMYEDPFSDKQIWLRFQLTNVNGAWPLVDCLVIPLLSRLIDLS